MPNLDRTEIAKFDQQGMLDRILDFPQQLQDALSLSKSANFSLPGKHIRNICVSGMGGSAIGGDIVGSYLSGVLKIPFAVNRFYQLPNYIDANSLVITCSYSGNTEETLSAYDDAVDRKAQIVCVSSGGTLANKAASNGHPIFSVPSGFPPRSALGYLIVPILYSLHFAGLSEDPEADILETIDLLGQLAEEYHPDKRNNLAKEISCSLKYKIPLIYVSVSGFEAVAWRWKGQLSENSKVMAFCNVFPELNHNEIMGWGPNAELNRKYQVVYLRDRDDHNRVKKRMQISKSIIEEYTNSIVEVESRGNSLLTRIFSLIFLGDMVSLYLAILNQVDPTSIKNIDFLKQELTA